MPIEEIIGKCQICASCCRYEPLVLVRDGDAKEIQTKTGMKPEEFIKDGLLAIKEDGSCIFLKQDGKTYSCTVYPVRPQSCRNFPNEDLYLIFCAPKLKEIS